MLNSSNQAESITADKNQQIRIGLWKVKLPELIDRPEIVTRTDLYNIDLADFHQWVGGLNNNITQLIASEISYLLKTERVVISPWSSYRNNDYQVKIHINRFDGELGGESVLAGAWSLLNAQGNKELLRKSFNYSALAKGETYANMVEAQSELSVKLAENISVSISEMKK